MPHIDGHIEGLPGSPGIISIDFGKEKKGIWFVPSPDFDAETMKDQDIGFHLLEIPTTEGSVLIAYDVVLKTQAEKGKADEMDKKYVNTAEFVKYYKNEKDAAGAINRVKDRLLDLDTLKKWHQKIKEEKDATSERKVTSEQLV